MCVLCRHEIEKADPVHEIDVHLEEGLHTWRDRHAMRAHAGSGGEQAWPTRSKVEEIGKTKSRTL